MKVKLKTAPAKMPLELNEVKDHLNIELDFTDDDDYLKTLVPTATQTVEQFLHRRLITQTWYQYLDGWWYNSLTMPFGRLQGVTSIKYKDTDGTDSTWDSANYIVEANSDPGEIVLGYEKTFPTTTLYPSNPITIEFVCGYGTDGTDIEANIKHAIKLIISDLYENRETQVIAGGSTSLYELPTAMNLLTPFKIDWF